LSFGLLYTPFLFLRSFLRAGSPIGGPARRRIWMELVLLVLTWAAIVAAVAWLGWGRDFLVLYLAPAILAGNMQSWRKYIEHMGLTGRTVAGSTRTVVSSGRLGRLFAFTLLHEPYHGVHHRYARLPHDRLAAFVDVLDSTREPSPVYGSYWQALWPMLRSLRDPRIGAGWLPPSVPAPAARAVPAAKEHSSLPARAAGSACGTPLAP
jgi:fatty acid desaturase